MNSPRTATRRKLVLFLIVALPLSGCGDRPADSVADDAAPGSSSVSAPVREAPFEPADPGLVGNARFEMAAAGGIAPPWGFRQHSGETSYELETDAGVATIRRIAIEPWGQLLQRVDLKAYRGQRMVYSAEFAGDLNGDYGEPMSATGLGIVISGTSSMPGIGGRPTVFDAEGQPQLGTTRFDWTQQQIVFDVPERAESAELTIRMTLGGELRVRNPRLYVVDHVENEAEALPE